MNIINPDIAAKYSVIWLHGLGADGNDFVPIVPELQLPDDMPTRFIFPDAPMRPVTLNQGYVMRAWFDITSLQNFSGIDEKGIRESIASIQQLIEQEISSGVPAKNIFLAGFSQGAVMAMLTGLGYSQSLAGIIALSGFLPYADKVIRETHSANEQIPIFLAHGTADPIVPYFWGEATYAALRQADLDVAWHSYMGMPHSVCEQEIRDIRAWLIKNKG